MTESQNLGPMTRTVQGTVQGSGRRHRPVTEKRRMQNRTAQRKYREKQVNRLRELEFLATQITNSFGKATGDQLAPPFCAEISNMSNHSLRELSEVCQASRGDTSLQASTSDPMELSLSFSSLEPELDISASGEDILPSLPFNDIPEISFEFSDANVEFPQTNGPHEMAMHNSFQEDDVLQTQTSSLNTISEPTTSFLEELNSMPSTATLGAPETSHSAGNEFHYVTLGTAYHGGQSPDLISMTQLVRRIGTRGDPNLVKTHSRGLTNDIIRWLRLDDTEEHKRLIRTAIERRRSVRDVILTGLQTLEVRDTDELEILSNTSLRLPDSQRNNLSLVRTSTLQAYLSNARAIGMSIDELYRDDCSSPFYRPQTNGTQDMSVVLKSFSDEIAPHLRPTSAQVLHPHHPWLDLIPFPTLRERAITLASMNPPLLDVKELKLDVIMNDGLTCWHVSEKSSAQPWDMRSWEAAPWFLRKYWMLIGGLESEVWAQTKWWRGMRGEKEVDLWWGSS
ncbi:hypothetical protein AOQ84DRAFT_25212 [Glonium stellatum]|uniref:BZIP domain-containing protein n=1 Tax=Glonium stellatum TaxID=574774 RepID=A0A8E2JTP5_9PEZI|nr:hypothetical protein AOQ84DRAFT_25212 [Glonium stellatum]